MPNEKRIIDEYDFLSAEFDKRYPQYASPNSPFECEMSARAFKRFCESNEWTIADRFEKDFLQRSEWSRKI